MIYLGNHADLLSDELINNLLTTSGDVQPNRTNDCYQPEFSEYTRKSIELHPNLYWEVFESTNENCKINWPVPLSNNYEEVIFKMVPGNYIPIHMDPNPNKCRRYFMALKDYEIGHILVWGGNFLKDYKKGDLWQFNNILDVHGSGNIGHTVRLVAHLTVWD